MDEGSFLVLGALWLGNDLGGTRVELVGLCSGCPFPEDFFESLDHRMGEAAFAFQACDGGMRFAFGGNVNDDFEHEIPSVAGREIIVVRS